MKRSSSVDDFQQIDSTILVTHPNETTSTREKKTDLLHELGVRENRIDRPDDEMKGKKQ